uniref:Uncharacterized protein n=1 Tax=Amphimedon queenslandica TaxID=400682 RepID=A0A1X7SQH5_AMPQE
MKESQVENQGADKLEYSCSAEIPQNGIVEFNPVHNGSNTDGLFLQWYTNQSACGMNVSDVHVHCENAQQATHCMNYYSESAGTISCLKTNLNLCSSCSISQGTPATRCYTHSANSICPTITQNLSSSFSALNTQYSQSNIPLTVESTATIDSSPAIVTSTTQYSSTSMTHDSSSVVASPFDDFSSSSFADLFSPSPSPTSLYCPPDPLWPLTPAGCDAPLNRTCHYGLFNATRHCNESGNWDPVNCLADKNFEAIVLLASSSPYDALVSLSNNISTIPGIQTVVLLDIIASSNARNATTTEEFGQLLLRTFDQFLKGINVSLYDEEVSIKIF